MLRQTSALALNLFHRAVTDAFHQTLQSPVRRRSPCFGLAIERLEDRTVPSITLVSGPPLSNSDSSFPSVSADGRYVAFVSDASNLVPNDTNGATDEFVKDTRTGAITRVSTDANGNQGDSASFRPSISGNGRDVAFMSNATNLVPGDTNGTTDGFEKDLRTGAITRVSTDANGNQGNGFSDVPPSISGNGRYVAFSSNSTNLVPGDTNGTYDVFVKDLRTEAITRVSTDAQGGQANGASTFSSISDNGRDVAFSSDATNLVLDDTNGTTDVFVKDVWKGDIALVSANAAGKEGNAASDQPSISDNGKDVAFTSTASNLVPGDTNGRADVFLVRLFPWEV